MTIERLMNTNAQSRDLLKRQLCGFTQAAKAEHLNAIAEEMMSNKSGEIDIERAQAELIQAAAQLQFLKKIRAKK